MKLIKVSSSEKRTDFLNVDQGNIESIVVYNTKLRVTVIIFLMNTTEITLTLNKTKESIYPTVVKKIHDFFKYVPILSPDKILEESLFNYLKKGN